MRMRLPVTTVLLLIFSCLFSVGLQTATTSSASATGCGPAPEWSYATRKLSQSRKDLSGVYSMRNSNKTESASLSVEITSSSSDSSTVTAGASYSLDTIISHVEAHFEVSVTRTVSSGINVTAEMKVMPLYYGRMKWQTVRTVFERYRWRYYGALCTKQTETIWKARLITSKVHFAQCQDKTNTCTPK